MLLHETKDRPKEKNMPPAKQSRKQFHFLDKLEDSRGARIFVSLVLGLGIASLFRLTCVGGQCQVIRGPNLEEVHRHVYRIDNQCYKYSTVPAKCTSFEAETGKPAEWEK